MDITIEILQKIMDDTKVKLIDGYKVVFTGHILDIPRIYNKKEIMSIWYDEINHAHIITTYK